PISRGRQTSPGSSNRLRRSAGRSRRSAASNSVSLMVIRGPTTAPVDCGNEATAMTDAIQRLAMREAHRQYARWLAVWSGTSPLRPGSCRPPFRRCPTCPASAGRERAQFVVGDPTVAIRVGGFEALALVGENL